MNKSSQKRIANVVAALEKLGGVSKTSAKFLPNAYVKSLAKELAELTHHNDHMGAYATLANAIFPNKRYQAAWEGMLALREYRGSVDGGLNDLQREMYKELMDRLKQTLSPEHYEMIHKSL